MTVGTSSCTGGKVIADQKFQTPGAQGNEWVSLCMLKSFRMMEALEKEREIMRQVPQSLRMTERLGDDSNWGGGERQLSSMIKEV